MAIIIREAVDTDIPKAMEMEAAAYAATRTPSGSVLFPGPFPPDAHQQRIQRLINSKADPATIFMIAVDEATDEQMAFSQWYIYKTEEEAKAAPERTIPSGPGVNEEACKAFFGPLGSKKTEIMGNAPHIYLRLLHTGPQYQKRGAASALLNWGTQRADEFGLPVYLESSLDAYPLYQKHGFKHVGSVEVDLTPYGGEGLRHSAPCMVRAATRASA